MSVVAKMVELLEALSSSDNQKRHQAETMFQQAKAGSPDDLCSGFVQVLGEQSVAEATRKQAAVLLRQMVSAGRADKDFVFAKLNPTNKQSIAAHLLSRFEAIGEPKLQQQVGDVIAKLAETVSDEKDQRGWMAPGQRGWPNLLATVFRLADPTDSTLNPNLVEAAIRLLKDLIGTFKDEIVQAQAQLGAVVQGSLAHANPKIRCAAFVLVCEMVGILEKKNWAPLMATAGVLTGVIQQLAQAQMQEELQECLQQYLEVAQLEPDFFKTQLQQSGEPATTLSKLASTTGLEEGVRNMSLEWLVTYAEKKPKWLAKSLPSFAPSVLESCMKLMLEIEGGDEELREWVERMDDEEGEEDTDELYHTGEEAIDRVVEALGMDTVKQHLFGLIGQFTQQEAWQAKLAALTAVKQTIEYVEETDHMNEMAKLLLMSMDHPHPRVRYTALHALGQLSNDQAPQFQDAWHKEVMPVLLRKMDDQIDRVASMAMSAFVSFGEELENALMNQYARGFMEKLVTKLQTSQHRMVQEECVTSIAVIAGVIEKDFSQYYDGIMPLLKQLVLKATGEKESRLRGKAFECMSLLGLAVGKEKFKPDAQQAIEAMLQTNAAADDLQKEYLKEAFERICKCLKADFAPFLPHLLPGLFKSLKLEAEDVGQAAGQTVAGGQNNEDDEFITVSTGDGKLVKVRSTKFEELLQSAQLLNTYCEEMEGAYFDYVQPTAQALMPLLSASDEMSLLCDEARSAAFLTWATLIKCARSGAKERGQPPTVAGELLRTFLQQAISIMKSDDDAETIKDAADGLAECLKQCEPGSISAQEVQGLVGELFQFIDTSFKRTIELEKEKKEGTAGAPQELQGDEDDEDNTLDEEDNCRRSLEDAIGSVMKAAPQDFVACIPECGRRMQEWLSTKDHKALALLLACDMLEHLKELSEPAWPVFMQQALDLLGDKDPELRTPSAYAISLAAPIPNFAQAAPEAFKRLAVWVSKPAPKKRDDGGKIAMDNCVSALLSLMQHKGQLCPPEVPAYQLIVAKLPLREDEDEAKKVHKTICEMLLSQNAGLMGPDNANIGKILSALAEVYKQENLSAKETDTLILKIFHMLPRENLQQLAGTFTEKQQKKIEKMLTEQVS